MTITSLLLRTDFEAVLPAHLCPISIHRTDLHRILWEACAASGVSLFLGHALKQVEVDGQQPAVLCETATGDVRISGDLVIGADGVKSVVRETGGFITHLDPIIEGSVQGVAPLSLPEHLHGEYFGRGEACGMLPMAAHAMSPNLGQGANCALVDALALACHIAERPANLRESLKRFEGDRRPVVDRIQRRGQQEGVLGTQRWPGADLLFKLAIRASGLASRARRCAEVRMISGLVGEGFDLDAVGVHPPVPWLTCRLQADLA